MQRGLMKVRNKTTLKQVIKVIYRGVTGTYNLTNMHFFDEGRGWMRCEKFFFSLYFYSKIDGL